SGTHPPPELTNGRPRLHGRRKFGRRLRVRLGGGPEAMKGPIYRVRVPRRTERLQPPNLLDFELRIGPLHGNTAIAFRVGVDADNRALALLELHLEPIGGIRDLPLDPTGFDPFAHPAAA